MDQGVACISLMTVFVIYRSRSRPFGMDQSIIEEAQVQPVAQLLIASLPNSSVVPGENPCIAVYQQNIHGKGYLEQRIMVAIPMK